jgi:hypothetical protein
VAKVFDRHALSALPTGPGRLADRSPASRRGTAASVAAINYLLGAAYA